MNKQPFKVGDIVRLTILDKDAECGQWFETTVTGVSAKSGILLDMVGFIICFEEGEGEGNGLPRTIDLSARFHEDIQRFCFYSVLDWEDSADRQWDEFKASLELA